MKWCGQQGLENLNDLTGRRLHQYRIWRRNDGDLAPASEKTQMDTLRVFVRWLESIDAVVPDLYTKVLSPSLAPGENVRTASLDDHDARKVLAYLSKYHYATAEHVTLTLLWHTSMRMGGVRAIDVDDYHPRDQYVEVRHRPETGTPIKNKFRGERLVALSADTCELIDDYLASRRLDVLDEHGREPLLTTSQGRISRSSVRNYCYRFTRPCIYAGRCPHDRDPDDCSSMEHGAESTCPSSLSPHTLRRGSITHALENDVPYQILADRANVSTEVLKEHYDARDERSKMEQRRGYLDNL